MGKILQDRLHVCARCVQEAGEAGAFVTLRPCAGEAGGHSFETRASQSLGNFGDPPGAAGASGSSWDLQLRLLLPSTAEELLPACACQAVMWLLPASSRQPPNNPCLH